MGDPRRYTVPVTTAAGGGATAYTPATKGQIVNVIYTKTDFATGVDFTITTEDSGQNVWTENDVNSSKTVSPRQPVHTQAGVASALVDDGPIYAVNERIKIVVASGGDTKTGSFEVIVV